ncbi:MAG: hypothetical protein J0L92_12665 [Deltaproteobacteria bacterium]|nr:hypothetical protein [Deltaproteobacteria bacterium]
MHAARLHVALLAASIALVATPIAAQREIAPEAVVDVHLEAPSGPVHVGDPIEIVAHVTLRGGARGPWMLAPTSDGPAVEVVRGRLLSIDADVLERGDDRVEARLRIPVLARATGTTVLRARVEAYGCRDGRCRAIDGEGSLVLEVEP